MSARKTPLTLRLPFVMADCHWRLERVLSADADRPWAVSRQLLPCFELSGPERKFARSLLLRKRNLWLYRCNQREFCGDFIVVDMSASRPQRRDVVVLELKSGGALKLGGAGAGNQLQHSRRAVAELIGQRIVSVDSRVTLACGGEEAVQRWIESGQPPGAS